MAYEYVVMHYCDNKWFFGRASLSYKDLTDKDHKNAVPIIFYKLGLMEGLYEG